MESENSGVKKEAKAAPRGYKKSNKQVPAILAPGNYLLVRIQEAFNLIFTPAMNPLYYLGAITFLFFWVILGSGAYLYLFYNMSPDGAYESIRYISEDQKYYGGIIRSMHRYASDGIVIVILIHVFQVFFSDRFRQYRWVAWVSGAAILPVIWFEGASGYFLVWDKPAQALAMALSDMMDVLPLNADPVQRNFLTPDHINALLFFVMSYLHLAIPLLLLILAWVHCMRISMPLIHPPKSVTIVILSSLVALALIKPAASGEPANLMELVGSTQVDWFFVGMFPLMHLLDITPLTAWIAGSLFATVFVALPWIVPGPNKSEVERPAFEQAPIEVDNDKCKACVLCQQACPFEAMVVEKFPEGSPTAGRAVVSPEKCSECGFCVNACEFGLVSMGGVNKITMQTYIESLFQPQKGRVTPTSLAFVCERSFNQEGFYSGDRKRLASNEEVASVVIPCVGILSQTIIDASFKAGAKGVFVVDCRPLDCHYREARRRLKLSDDPERQKFHIENMEGDNLKVLSVSPFETEALVKKINEFNEAVKGAKKVDESNMKDGEV